MRTNFSDRIRASEAASPSRTTSNAKTLAAAIHQSHANTQVVIEAEDSGVKLGLADLWRYRELLYFLTWRDVKLRYKQTLLGAAWAIIQPLFAMLLFTMFFGRLARMPSDNIPYPLFAYAGLLPWTFFANAVTSSANSLIGSTNLVTKVYFPRMIIPAAPVLAGLIDLGIGFVLLVPLFIYYRVSIGWHFLFLPVLILLVTLIAFGVGMWMAAINVKYRDVRYALPFLVQLPGDVVIIGGGVVGTNAAKVALAVNAKSPHRHRRRDASFAVWPAVRLAGHRHFICRLDPDRRIRRNLFSARRRQLRRYYLKIHGSDYESRAFEQALSYRCALRVYKFA